MENNVERNKALEQQLNEVARKWKESTDSEQSAKLRNEVFLLGFDLCDDGSEIFVQVFGEVLNNYQVNKGDFSHYLKYVISKRKNNQYRDAIKYLENDSSSDDPPCDIPAERKKQDPAYIIEQLDPILELTANILNFAVHNNSRAANERRLQWFRLFYTEDITAAAKEDFSDLLFRHERDIFTAMELPYLDYYMTAVCRTLRDICFTPLKPYCEVINNSENLTQTPVPIPGTVSLCYLQSIGINVGPGARSNQYAFYKAEKKAILQY